MMNLASLGASVTATGVIGKDSSGEELLESFRSRGVRTENIFQDANRTTTLKVRVIAQHQQVVRYDKESDGPLSPICQSQVIKAIPELIQNADGVIMSDYGKGVITRSVLKCAIASALKYKVPICVDPKVEHFLQYTGVTCVTPNMMEALGGMRLVRPDPIGGVEALGKAILAKLKCRSALITQGEEGMTLFESDRSTHIPAKAKEVYDVTGAGDTVISVLTLALASGASLVQSAMISNVAAGIVVGKLGTASVTQEELKSVLHWL